MSVNDNIRLTLRSGRRMSFALLLGLIGALGAIAPLLAAVAVMAVVTPRPTYAPAAVDGDSVTWNLAKGFFAYLFRTDNPSKPIESSLHLRHDCSTSTGYALVVAKKVSVS